MHINNAYCKAQATYKELYSYKSYLLACCDD
jgi:hypothetical protein